MNNVHQTITNQIKIFESLRDEHLLILSISQQELELLNDYEADLLRKDFPLIQHSTDKVNLAIEDANVLKLLSEYMKVIDAERKNHSVNIVKLNEESNWLREEVTNLQSNLRKSEEKIVELEEENKHLKFLLELKSIDDMGSDTKHEKSKDLFELNNTDNSNPSDGEFKFPDTEFENKESPNTENVTNPSNASGFELPPRLKTLHNLVIQYASQGRYEVAIPLCKQTLEDLERTSGRNHPDVATMLNILALVYRDQNKFPDAITLLKEALVIRENTLGPVHVAVAANLNNLAVLYGKQKKFNDAEPLCKRSLIIREQLLGPDHPDVAKQLNNLALLCQNQNKYCEVESYYLRAIKIYTNAYGKQHEDVIKTKINLATAYMKQRKYKDAELIYKEIINEIHEQQCGGIAPNNKPIWMLAEEKQHRNVGGNFNTQKDEQESWENIHSHDWTMIYASMKNLASIYRIQNKTEAADIIDNFANENAQSQNQNKSQIKESVRINSSSEKNYIPKPSGMGLRTSSGYVGPDTWNVNCTNQMKYNLSIRPNNLNRSTGPIRPPRNSGAENFSIKYYKTPHTKEIPMTPLSSNTFYSNGDGGMKKASSMSLLPGAPNKSVSASQPIKMQPMLNSGQSWLSQGRTSSIENIKKAFGKRY